MLATLTEEHFSRTGWIFERKLDGIRILAFKDGPTVRLLSRNKLPQNSAYPEIVEALIEQPQSEFVIDGEVVAFERGTTSFSLLQQRRGTGGGRSKVAIYYYVFDIMHLDERDVRALPLLERKALLRDALDFTPRALRFTTHRATYGKRYLEEACAKGWEGLIAKNATAPYQGRRSSDWLKFKCIAEQEFVIGGFTDPKGSRTGFGALLVGYYEAGALRYAGLVGTGFSHELLERMHDRLRALEQPDPPFTKDGLPRKGVHWVKPRLVGQVGFTEWTRDGKLRHPRFLGLRSDKDAKDVVRERPRA